MNHDDARDALTFAEVYRRARLAGARECPPFDLQRGMNELLAWMDQAVEVVAEEGELDVPAMLGPQVELRGRRELLKELLTLALRSEDGPVVLTGVGGAGKSTVAAELAKRVHGWDRLVWWVSAADPASLSAGLVAVTHQLGGSSLDVEAIARGTADAPHRFWRLLERAPREWLLVFDNADDPWVLSVGDSPAGIQDGTGWVRSSRRGLVVVTSRETDPRIWGAARLYPVGQLAEADAALVLRDLAPAAGNDDQARVLARRLDRLPLALHLAGTYLGSEVAQWSTFAAYGHALDKGGKRSLIAGSGAQASPRPVGATVTRMAEISLDGLARHGVPQARALLRLVSCYAPTSIPISMLFESRATASLLGRVTASRSPRHLMKEALRGLRSVGLIENTPADSAATSTAATSTTVISVHPVVTESNRSCLDRPEPGSDLIRRIAVDLLFTATKRLCVDLPEDWPQYWLLGQHLLALLETTANHVDQKRLVMLMAATASTAGAFNLSGSSKATRALCRIALERCAALGETHPMSLRVRHQLAWAIANKGDLAEAETMYHDVLDTRLRILDPHDRDIIESRNELAWIAACQGRWPQAESRYRQTLRDCLRILGPDDNRTLITRHELAWTIANQDRLEEAHSAFLEILRDRQRVFSDDHPRTIATRHELAWIAVKQGSWAEAEALYRRVLERRRQILGTDHPDTLLTAHELAWTTALQGRWKEAKSLYEHVLQARHRTLGDDHPDTQMTQWALNELQHGRIVDAHHIV